MGKTMKDLPLDLYENNFYRFVDKVLNERNVRPALSNVVWDEKIKGLVDGMRSLCTCSIPLDDHPWCVPCQKLKEFLADENK